MRLFIVFCIITTGVVILKVVVVVVVVAAVVVVAFVVIVDIIVIVVVVVVATASCKPSVRQPSNGSASGHGGLVTRICNTATAVACEIITTRIP